MLSETLASQVFAATPRLPESLFEENGFDDFINDLQDDLALHSEANDIAAYIVAAPGISYCEALVTLASDASMLKPIGHSALVPLRVLRHLSPLRPTAFTEYILTFEEDHLFDVLQFIRYCIEKPPPTRALFMLDEQVSWERIFDTCSKLIQWEHIFDCEITPPATCAPSLGPPSDMSCSALFPAPASEPFEYHFPSFPGFVRRWISKLRIALCCYRSSTPDIYLHSRATRTPSLKTTEDYVAPRRFDDVRKQEVRYRRGNELMRAFVRDSNVYLNSQLLTKATLELLTKYEVHLGPLKKFGVTRAVNEGGGRQNETSGLNELIDDVNNGIRAPARWLLSHVFCGRVSGSDHDDSKTSWFPKRSSEGEKVHVPLSLQRITENVGPLLRSSQGGTVLPMLGCGKVGNLSMLTTRAGKISLLQAEWRDELPDEEFERAIDHGWEVGRTELC